MTWFRIVCWRKLAEITAQYVKKGQRILVAGDIEGIGLDRSRRHPRASLELARRPGTLSGRPRGRRGRQGAAEVKEGVGDEIPF